MRTDMLGFFSTFRWSMQLASWATPHIKSWTLERSISRVEGERYLKTRNYPEAEKHLALAVAEADQRRHSVRKIQFRLQLAEAQRKQGKLREAEQTVRTALEHTARICNPSGYVQCLDALAEVFHDGENFAAMEKVVQEGIRIEASMPHPDPLRMARRVHRLGIARHKSGRSADAIPALEKALTLHEQTCGEEHLDTSNILSELGVIYRALRKHQNAQRCLSRALRIHEKTFGHDSEEAMRDRHNLAGSLEESGDWEGAAAQYERALTLKQRVMGGDLEDLADLQFSLAGMYIGWANYSRARELLAEAIGIFKGRKGERLAVAYETVAYVEECSGRFNEAVTELARAAKIWETCGPERRAELAENMAHRAELLDQLRKKNEAVWLRERAAELMSNAARAS
jgi:tetratricopeptide (TPR) repeat protein